MSAEKSASVLRGPPKLGTDDGVGGAGQSGNTGPGTMDTPLYCAEKGAARMNSGYE